MGSQLLSGWLRRWWAAALLMRADDAARLAGAESAASLAASQGRLATLRQRQERAEGEGARASREREEEAQKQLQLARRRLLAEQERRAATSGELREVAAARDAMTRQLGEARAEAARARRGREESERAQAEGAAAGREAAEVAARSEEREATEARHIHDARQDEATRADASDVAARGEHGVDLLGVEAEAAQLRHSLQQASCTCRHRAHRAPPGA